MDSMTTSKIYILIENFFSALVLTQTVVITSGTCFSLAHGTEDCENPVRTWLIVNSAVSVGLVLITFIWRFFGFICWWIWNLFWTVMATIWILGDSDCDDKFGFGYVTGGILIILSFFLMTGLAGMSCFIGIGKNFEHGMNPHYEAVG